MQPPVPTRAKGFALLITITLVAFLVLVLVALASFTRVETQVASNSQQQEQARQNALMALNIAIGELQKYTGPDQRTTARSDMDVNLANTTTASGRWLGAYGSGAEADYSMVPSAISTAVVNASNDKGSQAKLLNWLVSGNESTAFVPSSDVGPKGDIITPPSSFQFLPTGTVTGLSASVNALTNLTVADKDNTAKPARLLVGPTTAGNSIADYVVAPLRDITAEAPGMGTEPVPVGRYAWWVGDEGAKARVNLPMATGIQRANAFASSQRAAVELVDRQNPSGSTSLVSTQMLDPAGTDSRYNPNSPLLARLLSPHQLPMLSASSATALSTTAKYRYHDLTAWSISVLSDTYAGGLKKDLSAVLSKNALSPLITDSIFPAEPGSLTNRFGMPTWGQLRSHVQTFGSATGLTPRSPTMQRRIPTDTFPTATSVGVSPVMTYSTLGLTYGVPQSAMPPFDEVGKPLRLAFFPVVVLWNPYTSPIAAAKYQVGFRKYYDGEIQLQYYDVAASAWLGLDNFNLDNYRYLRFVIDAPEIPAGKSYIFTLKQSGRNYVAADASNPLEFGFRPANHAVVQSTLSIAQVGRQYRVGVNGRGTVDTPAKADSGYFVPKTLNGSSTHSFGRGTPFYSYLAPHNAIAPPSEFPYNKTTYASLGWYQSIGSIDTGNNITPYGLNPGYSRSQLRNGLIRNEGLIEMITEPTFRMSFRATFQGSRNRWIAHGNPRAFMIDRESRGGVINWTASPGDYNWPNDLKVFGDDPENEAYASAGTSLNDTSPSATDPVDLALFEFRPENQPLLSIGQLQHANLAWITNYPSYAIGNSLGAPALVSNPAALMKITNPGGVYELSLPNTSSAYYDMSWLLNHALWDKYFVSTVPYEGSGKSTDTDSSPIPEQLSNPRHVRYVSPVDSALTIAQRDSNLRDASKAAAGLLLNGGFNINSTSEQAWRAVLGSANLLDFDPVAQQSNGALLTSAMSRFSKPLSGSPAVAAIDSTNVWTGYRSLDATQIAVLAQKIVAEIRSRGPSISLADFINRRLSHSRDTAGADPFPRENDKRLKGAIQAAIDAVPSGIGTINSNTTTPFMAPLVSESWNAPVTNVFKAGMVGSANALQVVAPVSATSSFSPQYLTQADVLSVIGSGLAARSDTFVIRTYGEVLSPVDSTQPTGRAWCEAIVQRTPEYVDSFGDPVPQDAPTLDANKHLGRRYKVVSFRWLSASDI